VLLLLGERLTNAEIAARLFISVRTIGSHVSSLLARLGAADRRTLATSDSPPPATKRSMIDLHNLRRAILTMPGCSSA
jgi:hypothetical protein